MPVWGILIVTFQGGAGDSAAHSSAVNVLKTIIAAVEWRGMAFSLDIRFIDRQKIIEILHPEIDFSDCAFAENCQWWTWASGPAKDTRAPVWWQTPQMVVVSQFVDPLRNTDDFLMIAPASVHTHRRGRVVGVSRHSYWNNSHTPVGCHNRPGPD